MKNKRLLSLSIILPAYNEEDSLLDAILDAKNSLQAYCRELEIIVIDDASSDQTLQEAQKAQDQLGKDHVIIIRNEQNMGQGSSLIKGITQARYQWIFHNGVDRPFEFKNLPQAIFDHLEDDLIVFVRQDRSAYTWTRKIISLVFVRLINMFFATPIKDFSFVQAFKKDLVNECLNPQFHSTAFFMPSFILNAYRKGRRIALLKAPYQPRRWGKATGARFKNIVDGFFDLLRYRLGLFSQDKTTNN